MFYQLHTKEVYDLIANFEKVTGQRPDPFNHDCFGTAEYYKEYLRHCDVNEKHPPWQENEEFLKELEEYEKTLNNN